jgi:hypothetical protein
MAVTARQFMLTAETGPARIPILFSAFGYVPSQGRPRTIEQWEVEADLKQALFAITTEIEGGRRYVGGDQTLTLTPAQIELLRQRIVENPLWNPFLADAIAETYRWLGLSSVVAAAPPAAAAEGASA